MQLRLRAALPLVVLMALAGGAAAESELIIRGVYYKERATRVIPPMFDARIETSETGVLQAHLLVDAITSASAASGATDEPFSEKRTEGGLRYTHTFGIAKLGARGRYSQEPDYESAFGGLNAGLELADRNFTIDGAIGYGKDDYNNRAGGIDPIVLIEGKMRTYIGSLAASQVLSRNAIASVGYDLIYLDGDQHNLYRVEGVAGVAEREKHPRKRTRHAMAATVKWFVPAWTTTFIANFRYYHDDWGLHAGTPEVRAIKDLGNDDTAWFTLRYRFHRQTEAYFYEDRYPMVRADMLVSDDAKLGAFDNHTMTAKLEVVGQALGWTEGRIATTRGQIVIEYVAQGNSFGNAVVAHAALTIPFDY